MSHTSEYEVTNSIGCPFDRFKYTNMYVTFSTDKTSNSCEVKCKYKGVCEFRPGSIMTG